MFLSIKQNWLTTCLIVLSVAAMAAAIVGGCGGEQNSSAEEDGPQEYDVVASTTMTTASPPISKAEFVSRMNRLCRTAWKTVVGNYTEYSSTQDPKLSRRARSAEAIQLSLLSGVDFHIFDNFRQMGAPKGDEREIEEMIGPFQAAVELGWEKRWVAYAPVDVAPRFAEFNVRAKRYGLHDCLVDRAHLKEVKLSQPKP